MALNYPDLLPGVFAADANDHEDIPDSGAATGRMSWDVGFPIETSQPTSIGGVPPRRLDMNGLGNRLSQHVLWQQSGGLYMWDATLDYPPYAHVIGSDGKEYIASAPSGPSQGSGPVNPVTDVNFTKWKSFQRSLVDIIYPVGSIYMSVNSTSPAVLFGGVWQAITGRFLLAADNGGSYPIGTTGGSATKKLAVNEMPVHNHGTVNTGDAGNHNHAATNTNDGAHTHTITVNNNGAHTHSVSGSAANAGAHTHGISITNGAQSAGAHTHGVTYAAQGISINTGSAGAHTHTASFPKTTLTSTSVSNHTHGPGTMEIKGTFDADDLNNDDTVPSVTGAFGYKQSKTRRDAQNGSKHGYAITFDATKDSGWTGATAANGGHNHTVTIAATSMTTSNAGAHSHGVSFTIPAQNMTTGSAGAHTHNISGTSGSAGSHTHTVSGTAASAGTHNHTAGSGSAGSHTHTITVQNNGTHRHSVTVANAGGNAVFSIMPPYLAVNVWKRTA